MTAADTADLNLIAAQAQRFAQTEVRPHLAQWEADGRIPPEIHLKLGALGWLGMGYPESLGGVPASWALRTALSIALSRYTGSGGFLAGAFSHTIGLPPIAQHGSETLRRRVVPEVLAGRAIAALAVTEPGGGSDVASLRTTAVREGDHYVIEGEKTFITSGLRADWFTVAVRTDPEVRGAGGISLLAVPGDAPGLTRHELAKMGWLCSDTASLHFDRVRVPADHLLGSEHQGFRLIMANFNAERMNIAAIALGASQCCHDEALAWARERRTFGQALVGHQVIRHKLMDMRMKIEATRAWLCDVAQRADRGVMDPDWVADVCLLKNFATQTMQFCADQAVQILGGMGYMRGTDSERIYREVKVLMIGGGAEEIMKELAARQLGV